MPTDTSLELVPHNIANVPQPPALELGMELNNIANVPQPPAINAPHPPAMANGWSGFFFNRLERLSALGYGRLAARVGFGVATSVAVSALAIGLTASVMYNRTNQDTSDDGEMSKWVALGLASFFGSVVGGIVGLGVTLGVANHLSDTQPADEHQNVA